MSEAIDGRTTTVSVTAEWALYGNAGNSIIACSAGRLSRENFVQATDRFLRGILENPPQVSVSFLNRGSDRYLCLAIYEHGRTGESDRTERRIERTRYFCVRYMELAHEGVGYRAMHEAFRGIQLSARASEPLRVRITMPRLLTPAVDALAIKVAALLLTDRHVCVLGAQSTSVSDRLAFIDTVMALLPYGMRATMAAATWTRAVSRDHKYRLFFSSDPRPGRAEDHIVTWGAPEHAVVPAEFEDAIDYLAWLAENVGEPTIRLASLIEPKKFDIGSLRDVAAGVPDSPMLACDLTEEILLDCVAQLNTSNPGKLIENVVTLQVHAAHARIRAEDRARYRRIVTDHGLLSPGLPLGNMTDMFYDMLLALAFGTPLDYATYCELEGCLAQKPGSAKPARAHPSLFAAILRAVRAAVASGNHDARVAVIVAYYLDASEHDTWFSAAGLDGARLIEVLAEDWPQPHHAKLALEVVTNRLRALRDSNNRSGWQAVLKALGAHGHLAATFEARYRHSSNDQLDALSQLLGAVYPDNLDESTVRDILVPGARTSALLGVVFRKTTDSAVMTWILELIRQQGGGGPAGGGI